jgi:hypothetical protein
MLLRKIFDSSISKIDFLTKEYYIICELMSSQNPGDDNDDHPFAGLRNYHAGWLFKLVAYDRETERQIKLNASIYRALETRRLNDKQPPK